MAMKARYTVAYGEVISQKRGGVRSLLVPDPLGSNVALFDATQTKTDTWSYFPYGEVKTRTGTTTLPFQFVGTLGYYNDSSTRTYVRARYLDTQKGRWVTEDPIGFGGMDWNLYQYVGNQPVTVADPSGMIFPCAIAAICGIGLIGAIYRCQGDPKGFFHCMCVFCVENPVLCAILKTACGAAIIACIPALAPVIGCLPIWGTAGIKANSDPCADPPKDKPGKPTDPVEKALWCIAKCRIAFPNDDFKQSLCVRRCIHSDYIPAPGSL